jgi:hypothetical protein
LILSCLFLFCSSAASWLLSVGERSDESSEYPLMSLPLVFNEFATLKFLSIDTLSR